MRKAYKDIINSIKLDPFKPLDILDLLCLMRSYLLKSCQVDNLVSYFDYFIREKEFKLIVMNINKYIKAYLILYLKVN